MTPQRVSADEPTTRPDDPLRVAVVIGSAREGRFGPTVAGWFAGRVADRAGLRADLVDVRDRAPGEKLSRADAFVIVTPEYNHSFPGALKILIDDHVTEWHAKPVAFVSYGGISGGLRAVEQLRPVFAELHAVTVRDTVSFAHPWHRFDDTGGLLDPGDAEAAAATLLDRLTWWGAALRTARATHPYGR
ncbi:NADPH-dependent FMN reductase [Nocardia thailandica]